MKIGEDAMFFMKFFDNLEERPGRVRRFIHRTLNLLLVSTFIHALFHCYLSVSGAVQDARKYGGLGFVYPFTHYLEINGFWENVSLFACSILGLILYWWLSRRLRRDKRGQE